MRRMAVEAVKGGESVSEAARTFGMSRKTLYKWLERSEGETGFEDRSRARHELDRFQGELADWILSLRRRYPRWGPQKLLDYAERRRPEESWPARSTVAALLKRNGLIGAKKPSGGRFHVPFRFAGPIP